MEAGALFWPVEASKLLYKVTNLYQLNWLRVSADESDELTLEARRCR